MYWNLKEEGEREQKVRKEIAQLFLINRKKRVKNHRGIGAELEQNISNFARMHKNS